MQMTKNTFTFFNWWRKGPNAEGPDELKKEENYIFLPGKNDQKAFLLLTKRSSPLQGRCGSTIMDKEGDKKIQMGLAPI